MTTAQKDIIKKSFNGTNQKEVAERLGFSYRYVEAFLREEGLMKRKIGPRSQRLKSWTKSPVSKRDVPAIYSNKSPYGIAS